VCAILKVGGTMWEAYGTIWKLLYVPCDGHMGVVCSIWEPCVLYGSRVHDMGDACTVWELQMPHRSHMHHMGAACTV
jgi:hypothetical protein